MSNKLKLINGLEISNIGLGAEIIEYDNLEKFENEYEFYCYTLESGICDLYDTSAAYSRNDEALGKAIRDTHM